MPSDALAEQVLRFVQAKGYQPRQIHELALAMGVGVAEQGDFHAACKALMKTGRVVLGSRQAVMLPDPPGKLVGTYRGNERGFGFVIPDTPNSHGDLYVPSGKTGDAITGDTVMARVLKRGRRSGQMVYEGRIVEVVKRGQSRFVGALHQQRQRWLVVPDGNTLHVPIMVGDPGAKNARAGDQVVVEITQYPGADRKARGVIVKVLGRRGEPDVDTQSIIEQYQLPGEFSREVLQEARDAANSFDPRRVSTSREDLRHLTIITIDPVDARDYDDAISLTSNKNGTVELGVHIADVAHFVREGTALDEEARQRSTSIYLPRTVIPMLPEVLSNSVCSLQERQTRLAKSAFITYDRKGSVKKVRLANTVIRSAKRLTYEQASAILAGRRVRTSDRIVSLLKGMERLAQAIRARRIREGMFELDLPEVELVYDENGYVVDVKGVDTSYSHKIIEMFMVEANEAVARHLTDRKVPFLRRIHDKPRAMAGGSLRRLVALFGHELSDPTDRFAVQRLLDQVRGKDDAFAIHLAVLRGMQQAEYAPTRMGHYALASQHYTHFTSPIRRYPDLTIHRLIDQSLQGAFKKRGSRERIPTEEELSTLGHDCSTQERRSEAAERELKLVLVLRLLEKSHLGDVFNGVVTGVANVGVFVQLERFLIDGLLRFDDLPDDWWDVDPTHGCVVGERSGQRITVGDRLQVTITTIRLPTRQMTLTLASPLSQSKTSPRKRATSGGNRRLNRLNIKGNRPHAPAGGEVPQAVPGRCTPVRNVVTDLEGLDRYRKTELALWVP